MDTMTVLYVLFIAVSLLLVAFFSSSEASLISANKTRIRHMAQQGHRGAAAVTRVAQRHVKFFSAILLTEDALIILASVLGERLFSHLFGRSGLSLLLATVVMTLLVVAFGEITPKSLAAQRAVGWSVIVARPIELVMALETAILFLFTAVPRRLSRLLGGQDPLHGSTITEGELRMLIDIGEAEGAVEPREAEMLEKVFRFGDRRVQEVMAPRTEVVGVEKGTTLRQFLAIYAQHPHTRFPVFEGNLDNVVGILSAKEVLRAMARGTLGEESPVTGLLHPATFFPETRLLGELFSELRQTGQEMAIVVDEFGGVDGLVTLKQLVEEVVGRMGETRSGEAVQTIDANTLQIDGSMRVDLANERLGLDIPEGDYETVAGFLLYRLRRIPAEGDHLDHGAVRLVISQMRGVKIEKLQVARTSAAPQ